MTQMNLNPSQGGRGRVIYKNRGIYKVAFEDLVVDATLTGRFSKEADGNIDLPAVGDWVDLEKQGTSYRIKQLLPRKQVFLRKQKDHGKKRLDGGGTTQEQVLAANIDKAIIVTGLDNNFNINRIERYLTLVYNGGAQPIIVMSKADLCHDLEDKLNLVKSIAFGVPVFGVSAITGEGMADFVAAIKPGETLVFIGSSGVGKSTLTNALIGSQVQDTAVTQEGTQKGRHTTTSAELITGKNGISIIDTPGLREVQLWADEETLDMTFEDVASLMEACKFSNCTHDNEPGCAVLEALENGTLSQSRYDHYLKLQREIAFLDKKKKTLEKSKNKKSQKYQRRQKHKQDI